MAIDLTPEQKALGKANFQKAAAQHGAGTRRDFLKGMLAAGATVPIGAAAYFAYQKLEGGPVRAGLIGGGDEGGVLVGNHNPDYLQFVAVSDIRPSNVKRIFDGEGKAPRWGFKHFYGNNCGKDIAVYSDYQELLKRPDIQAVVIAVPLHLHAQVAIDAMRAGKHVLCEKLMAWNITQCKQMIKVAEETDRLLSIGHQRHYSLLYAQALEVLQAGEIGEVRHIRALWHRNSAQPKLDKNGQPLIDAATGLPVLHDGWRPDIREEDRKALTDPALLKKYGYKSIEELVRWRLYNRTGGGLMAELGSHQLDACSIFLGKVKPLAVTGIGGKYFYRDDREIEDHVFCTFEFPGKNYWADPEHTQVKDKDDRIIVTYSSINTNAFEPYGECVMGVKGTMLVNTESEVYLFPEADKNKKDSSPERPTTVAVTQAAGPVVEASSTTGFSGARKSAVAALAGGATGPVSRGYTEEMEHFAYCVKMWEDKNVKKEDRPWVRCHGKVAMADAIVALTANLAMRGTKANGHKPQRIEFQKAWFDAASPEVPDAENHPEVS